MPESPARNILAKVLGFSRAEVIGCELLRVGWALTLWYLIPSTSVCSGPSYTVFWQIGHFAVLAYIARLCWIDVRAALALVGCGRAGMAKMDDVDESKMVASSAVAATQCTGGQHAAHFGLCNPTRMLPSSHPQCYRLPSGRQLRMDMRSQLGGSTRVARGMGFRRTVAP